jgi:hypothetical protein
MYGELEAKFHEFLIWVPVGINDQQYSSPPPHLTPEETAPGTHSLSSPRSGLDAMDKGKFLPLS